MDIGQNSPLLLNSKEKEHNRKQFESFRNGNAQASNFSSEKWKTIKFKWLFDKIYYYRYQSKLWNIKIS